MVRIQLIYDHSRHIAETDYPFLCKPAVVASKSVISHELIILYEARVLEGAAVTTPCSNARITSNLCNLEITFIRLYIYTKYQAEHTRKWYRGEAGRTPVFLANPPAWYSAYSRCFSLATLNLRECC